MKSNLSRIVLTLALVVGVAVKCRAGSVPAITDPNALTNTQQANNPSLLGDNICRIETSTGASVGVPCVTSGSGLVYAMEADSGTPGAYCIAADTAPPSYSNLTVDSVGLIVAKVISGGIGGVSGAGASVDTMTVSGICSTCGSYVPPVPVRFENGLAAVKSRSGAGVNCYIHYRLDTGKSFGGKT